MQPVTRLSLALIFLSVLIALTGNALLGTIGLITAFFSCSGNLERTPDMIFMLAFTMAVSTAMYMFAVLPFAFYMLAADPHRVCAHSKYVVQKFTEASKPYLGATVADGSANLTESAQGHDYQPLYQDRSSHFQKLMGYADQISDVVCGEDAKSWIVGFGMLVLLFLFCVLIPTFYISLRIMRHARQHGGCSECLHAVPMRGVAIHQQHFPEPRGPVRVQATRGQRVPPGFDSQAPVAHAVPVTVPHDVKVAPQPRSMM